MQIHIYTNREYLWKETQETEEGRQEKSRTSHEEGELLILYIPVNDLHFYLMHVTFSNNKFSCVE